MQSAASSVDETSQRQSEQALKRYTDQYKIICNVFQVNVPASYSRCDPGSIVCVCVFCLLALSCALAAGGLGSLPTMLLRSMQYGDASCQVQASWRLPATHYMPVFRLASSLRSLANVQSLIVASGIDWSTDDGMKETMTDLSRAPPS